MGVGLYGYCFKYIKGAKVVWPRCQIWKTETRARIKKVFGIGRGSLTNYEDSFWECVVNYVNKKRGSEWWWAKRDVG